MSRKSPTDQMAEDLGCLIIGLMWLAIVGFFTLLFKSTQVSPEDQLLKLQPGYAWLWQIEKTDCPECGATNESYAKRCDRCGARLVVPEAAVTQQPLPAADPANQGIIIAIVVLVILGAIILGLMASSGS